MTDPSENQPIGKPGPKPGPRDWSKSASPSRRCHAHKKTGEQCKNAALAGQSVCKYHGGAAGHSLKKARERLEAAADRMTERLLGLAENSLDDGTKVGAYVQLGAVTAALDRVGIVPPKQVSVEVTAKPYEELFGDIEGGSREAYRQAIGDERAGQFPAAIEPVSTNRSGGEATGVRVLGATFDGHAVIDGELVASAEEGEPEHAGRSGDPGDDSQALKQTLVNSVTPLIPMQGGYLPAEDAMEQAAEADRAHRRQMKRR